MVLSIQPLSSSFLQKIGPGVLSKYLAYMSPIHLPPLTDITNQCWLFNLSMGWGFHLHVPKASCVIHESEKMRPICYHHTGLQIYRKTFLVLCQRHNDISTLASLSATQRWPGHPPLSCTKWIWPFLQAIGLVLTTPDLICSTT